ncbi:hemolysin-III protein [Aspergillus japonicus CBS 114.51]|uniref:Hemolysin-III protein n=1 Tax=Aspergillus japonicus CBS 114.51 TaxID=1448312 RepID=A0A8T8WLA5_ASPJA|nr:hemolysin-III protein [Aspergillus japonicus CBS 114.51]RAH76631.1 hemolysin-III protein [Aspergillus japonicus CBS 114.51]
MSGAELKRRQVPKVNMDTGIDYTNQPKVKARTVTWQEISGWQLHNQYILDYREIFTSLTFLHDESCNVYSHLIGALLLPLVATTFGRKLAQPQFLGVSFMEYAMFGIYFWCAEICLPHSRRIEYFWHGMDLLGFVVVTVGTFSSGIYHVCFCEANLQKLHWAIVLVTGFVTGVLISNPLLKTTRWRKVKVGAFVIFGASSFLPLLHGLRLYGIGVSLYAVCLAPEGFDIWGSSHQIFHLAILGAMYTHQIALLQGFTACHTLDVCQLQGVY